MVLALCSGATQAAEEILIGQTADFSSVAGQQMKDFNLGVLAYFNQVNAKGGIKGRPITLISRDDAFQAAKAAGSRGVVIVVQGDPGCMELVSGL